MSALFLVFLITVTFLAIVLMLDKPSHFRLTSEEEDIRLFSVGTLENVSRKDFRFLKIQLDFQDIIESQANVEVLLYLEKMVTGKFETTFILILPFDAEIYYPPNLTILDKSYAKIVYFPFLIEETEEAKLQELDFIWASFSKRISMHRWTFDIDGRAFHYLFDDEGETFYALVPRSLNSSEDWLPLKINVNTKDGDYSFIDFHPGTEEHFEDSVSWIETAFIFDFHMSGTYQDDSARFEYHSSVRVAIFVAGAVSSLVVREMYEIMKEQRKRARKRKKDQD